MVKMERALMIWLEDCIAKKIPISGNLIKQKALKIYEHLRNIGHFYAGLENHSFVIVLEQCHQLARKLNHQRLMRVGNHFYPKWFKPIQDDSTLPVTEIVSIASRLSDEEFAVSHQDVKELVLREETLDEEELLELIDVPTTNALVNENKENQWVPNLDLQDVKKG
ncbi:hypothetical protein TNCT_417951 [Trichonephila clavata]|uniref:HTH CENPB-type domain-containing protein n=1 Tax=Trichonephila clavata TaxID=2740835 RepID=A0A8X6GF40_TRICU|nr:hypothetical protein TNCT_417951 [Trichonephila clavata]